MMSRSTHPTGETTEPLPPLPLRQAILHFLIAGIALRFAIYNVLPWLVEQGWAPYDAFLVASTAPMAILFVLAFVAVRREGVPLALPALARRFRLRRLSWRDLLWVLGAFAAVLVVSLVLAPLRPPILELLPALRENFPPLIDPTMQNQEFPGAIAAWIGAGARWPPILGRDLPGSASSGERRGQARGDTRLRRRGKPGLGRSSRRLAPGRGAALGHGSRRFLKCLLVSEGTARPSLPRNRRPGP